MIRMDHREEALLMLQGKGTILDTARAGYGRRHRFDSPPPADGEVRR